MDTKLEKKLRRLELARVIIGVLAIGAILAVIIGGIDALINQRDAGLAIRLPVLVAVLLLWAFGWCAKNILKLRFVLSR